MNALDRALLAILSNGPLDRPGLCPEFRRLVCVLKDEGLVEATCSEVRITERGRVEYQRAGNGVMVPG